MAFVKENLALAWMAGGKLPHRQWVYTTTDPATTVDGAGYFSGTGDNALNELGLGDVIRVIEVDSLVAPSSIAGVTEHVVVAHDGSAIDVSDATTITVTAGD